MFDRTHTLFLNLTTSNAICYHNSMIKWTYEDVANMYNDCASLTLAQVAGKYSVGGQGAGVRRLLTRYGFPSVVGKRKISYSLTDGEYGYIAGVIDSEGTIDLKTKCIAVTNTNIDLLLWLKSKLGGSAGSHMQGTEKHKPSYIWRLSTIGTRSLVPLLLEFLIVKKTKALRLIEHK